MSLKDRILARDTISRTEVQTALIDRLTAENRNLRATLQQREIDCTNLRAQVTMLVIALDRPSAPVVAAVTSELPSVAAAFPALGMTVSISTIGRRP